MKKWLGVLLFTIGCYGQQTFTIFQQVISDNRPCVNNVCTGSILPLPFASANMRAIGQANHAISLLLTNQTGQTCAGGPVDWNMEYSFDNSTFTRFGDVTASVSKNDDNQYAIVINAYGAYPYVRLKVRNYDTVKCKLSAYYSGVVAGQSTITISGGPVTVTNTPDVKVIPNGSLVNDYDSGLVTVPNVLTALTANNTLIQGIWCNNKTANPVNLTITNTAGTELIGGATPFAFAGGANGMILSSGKGIPIAGIKWLAGTAGALNCQVVGYQ